MVLVDLDKIEIPPDAQEIEIKSEPAKADEPIVKPTGYVEDDPNYVPPPSSLSPEAQKAVDKNLLEVHNFYSRKFASVRGDFN